MVDRAERKRLAAAAAGWADAGVYRIVNDVTGRSLLRASPNLAAVENRLRFAQTNESLSALDPRLVTDARSHGLAALRFEVLDRLPPRPGGVVAGQPGVEDELATLESLWRERFEPDELY
jgi:hypothetical protein